MAKGIHEVMMPNIAAEVETKTADTGTSTKSASAGAPSESTAAKVARNTNGVVDEFVNAVNETAKLTNAGRDALNSIDCGDLVFDWMKANVPGFAAAADLLDKSVNFLNGISGGMKIKGLVRNNTFTKAMCVFVEQWFGLIEGWIDIVSKAALVLFAKIDAARQKLQAALQSFTKAIQHCLLDIFDDIKNKINISIELSLSFDWAGLLKLMETCPCVAKLIANITGCTRDDAGNDITNDPYAVMSCVRSKLDFLDPAALTAGVNSVFSNYIEKYIKLAFKYIKKWIDFVFNTLIAPFRWLIKQYIKLITTKMDVTWFIESIGVMECFFKYSEEYKKGKKYYGMSVIDMINTWKQWIPCFENFCPGLTEKIRNKVKKMYEDLRLDDMYWRRAYEVDLYSVCMAVDADTARPKSTTMRKMYSDNALDSAVSGYMAAQNADDDAPNKIGPKPQSADFKANPVKDANKFLSAPENENGVNVGYRPITDKEQGDLKAIMSMLGQGEDDYYTEKQYQLLRFASGYAMDDTTVSALQTVLDKHGKQVGGFTDRKSTYSSFSKTRPATVAEDSQSKEKYTVASEYDKARAKGIMSFKFRSRKSGEDLASYYAAMYAAV